MSIRQVQDKQKITPCLWFNDKTEEAVNFYISLFPNSKIGSISRYDKTSAEVSGQREGSVLTVEFELFGQQFLALNGGLIFKLSEAISLVVNCETQEEIDKYWSSLSAVPEAEQCGWLKDKYGLSWQIVPTILNKLLTDTDKTKAGRVMQAMLEMKKIGIKKLEDAYNNIV